MIRCPMCYSTDNYDLEVYPPIHVCNNCKYYSAEAWPVDAYSWKNEFGHLVTRQVLIDARKHGASALVVDHINHEEWVMDGYHDGRFVLRWQSPNRRKGIIEGGWVIWYKKNDEDIDDNTNDLGQPLRPQ